MDIDTNSTQGADKHPQEQHEIADDKIVSGDELASLSSGGEEPKNLEFKLENFSSLTIKDSIGNLITYTLSKFPEMIFLSESRVINGITSGIKNAKKISKDFQNKLNDIVINIDLKFSDSVLPWSRIDKVHREGFGNYQHWTEQISLQCGNWNRLTIEKFPHREDMIYISSADGGLEGMKFKDGGDDTIYLSMQQLINEIEKEFSN